MDFRHCIEVICLLSLTLIFPAMISLLVFHVAVFAGQSHNNLGKIRGGERKKRKTGE